MKQKRKMPEVAIPVGYELDEFLEFDDSEFGEEQPIYTEEVRLRFARDNDKK